MAPDQPCLNFSNTVFRCQASPFGCNPFRPVFQKFPCSFECLRRIREKIEADPSHPVSLVTVKGLGYKLITEGR